jgi:glucose-1-phosphate cytidylyltransferase
MDRSELADGALLSYTDVFTDAPLAGLLEMVRGEGSALALMTVSPPLPWGIVRSDNNLVTSFDEKPRLQSLCANAGFYACASGILDYISAPGEMLENEPMRRMIEAGGVRSSHHEGQWLGIDNPKDVANAETGHTDLFGEQDQLTIG